MWDSDSLSTTEAARLVDRAEGALRSAIIAGQLPATRQGYAWRIDREDVERWNAERQRRSGFPKRHQNPGKQVLELLAAYETLTADELAQFLDLHPGNARKRFALLHKGGLVERSAAGEWMLTPAGRDAVASTAT